MLGGHQPQRKGLEVSEQEDRWREVERHARSAERWATISMWGSGCALVLWAIPILVGLAIFVWVYLALR
jgi:hypothetical protein